MKVRVGDRVIWRGGWGNHEPEVATVTEMEITEEPRSKYGGVGVDEANWSQVHQNRVLFTLDNGHWAYSDQIEQGCAE